MKENYGLNGFYGRRFVNLAAKAADVYGFPYHPQRSCQIQDSKNLNNQRNP